MELLETKNVSYTYQGKYQKVEALKNINCHFEKGKLYAIIGQSGSGKTTLLSILAGFCKPTSGEVYVDGKLLEKKDLESHRRDNISMIFQSFHLFPLLTVLENVMYPMQIIKEPKDIIENKAKELLEKVGIPATYYKKLPAMLSGGEQQRVAIARALASKANFILGDEPTGNLDSINGTKIIELFEKLVNQDYCVIIVTHDLSIAAKADVVYQMKDGNIELEK